MRLYKQARRRKRPQSSFQFEKLEPRQLLAADLLCPVADPVDTSATADIVNLSGTPTDESSANPGAFQRIVNGTQTQAYDAVGVVNNQCTGTLIAPNAVLTAAHCVEGISQTGGTFEVGGKVYTTTNMVIHPDYQSKDVDLAIMILSEDVQGVDPMELNRDTPQIGQLLTLVGFGATGNGNSGHNGNFGVKHVGTTPIDGVTSNSITWNFDNNGESNTAPGDSGGPAFLNQNGKQVIAGITSGGNRQDAAIGDFSFDTRVDAFVDWIDAIAGTSDTGGGGNGGEDPGGDGGGDNEPGQPETENTFISSTPVNIPGNKVATVATSAYASGMSGNITDVDVKLDINHTWNSDLKATLISPSGTQIVLFDGVGGSSNHFKGTVFDSQASQSINNAFAPFSGTFKPAVDLSLLKGEDANGKWTLEIEDDFPEDGGRINSFAVTIKTDGGGPITDLGGGGGDGGSDQAVTEGSFTSNTPVRIPGNKVATVSSSVSASGMIGKVTDVDVRLDINHTWNSDLKATLISPSGTRVVLFDGVGGSSNHFKGTNLDSQANQSINNASAPFSGTFKPAVDLSLLNGEDANGKWTLEVEDDFPEDGGRINSFTVLIKTDGDGVTTAPAGGGGGDGGSGPAITDKTFVSNALVNIPGNNVATVSSSVNSTGMTGNITDVDVQLDISHTWNSDLKATLISPSGTRVLLFDGIGGSSNNFSGTALDSQASQSINNASAPFAGSFKPTVNLSLLNGEVANGKWTLEVEDDFPEDGGSINSFAVSIKTDGGVFTNSAPVPAPVSTPTQPADFPIGAAWMDYFFAYYGDLEEDGAWW